MGTAFRREREDGEALTCQTRRRVPSHDLAMPAAVVPVARTYLLPYSNHDPAYTACSEPGPCPTALLLRPPPHRSTGFSDAPRSCWQSRSHRFCRVWLGAHFANGLRRFFSFLWRREMALPQQISKCGTSAAPAAPSPEPWSRGEGEVPSRATTRFIRTFLDSPISLPPTATPAAPCDRGTYHVPAEATRVSAERQLPSETLVLVKGPAPRSHTISCLA